MVNTNGILRPDAPIHDEMNRQRAQKILTEGLPIHDYKNRHRAQETEQLAIPPQLLDQYANAEFKRYNGDNFSVTLNGKLEVGIPQKRIVFRNNRRFGLFSIHIASLTEGGFMGVGVKVELIKGKNTNKWSPSSQTNIDALTAEDFDAFDEAIQDAKQILLPSREAGEVPAES